MDNSLRVDAAQFEGLHDAIDGDHVRGRPVRNTVTFRNSAQLVEVRDERVFQTFVHLGKLPEIAHTVLDPFEVRYGHAAGVCHDVGDDDDAAFVENAIRFRRRRTVRAFDDELRLDLRRILSGEHFLQRCRNEHVAFRLEQFGIADLVAAFEALEVVVALGVRNGLRDVDAVGVVVGTRHVRDADDFAAALLEELGRPAADVAEALDDDARVLRFDAHVREFVHAADHHAPSGGFDAAFGAADDQRFAGDDARNRLTHVHRVRIHEPRHRLRIGVDVGSGNVFVRTDDFDQFCGIPARDTLELALREFGRVAGDAAFTAAERQIDDRAFPRHPKGERRHFVQRHAGVETDAALGRAARETVLDAITGVHLEFTIVALERNREDDLARRVRQNGAHGGVEFQKLGSLVEIGDAVSEYGHFAHSSGHRALKPPVKNQTHHN